MKRLSFILLFSGASYFVKAQYRGGSNDGFSISTSSNQNPLPSVYYGGSNDGFGISSSTNQNSLSNIYFGGTNDGFSVSLVLDQNLLPAIYRGGSNDGFAFSATPDQHPLPSIYRGGANDGFSLSFVLNQNPTDCNDDTVYWTGSQNIRWDNPDNWDCGVLPGPNSNVIIPSGLIRYPTIFFATTIKSLHTLPGSTVTVAAGVALLLNN